MRQLAMICCALSLAACGNGEAARRSIQRNTQIFAAQDRVKAQLRDPGSAEFSDVTVPHEGISTVCGKVNSRNGFGGMSGPQRFIATKNSIFLEERQELVIPGYFAGFWQQMCG
jgi:hypothetical protein